MGSEIYTIVANELLRMAEIDQTMRQRAMEGHPWDAAVDAANTSRMKELVAVYGWPTITNVGREASQAAWLLVQHADHDPDFQAHCLALMKQLAPGDVSPVDIAYLEDRVRVHSGQPQRYGTQFYRAGDTFGPRPIEDWSLLDERRAAAGLQPFAAYRAIMEATDRTHQQAVSRQSPHKPQDTP